LGIFVVIMVVTALLGAGSLHEKAQDVSSGTLRGVALFFTDPIYDVSRFLHADRPLKWAEGSSDDDQQSASKQVSIVTKQPATSVTTSTGQVTTTTAPAVFTAQHPLKVLCIGDSMMLQVGHGITRAAASIPGLQVKFVSKPASGLVSSQRFDWPPNFKTMVADFQPNVTIMLFGGNEKITMVVGGENLQALTPEWVAEYRSRLNALFDTSTNAGARVIWIGLPIMRSGKFSETCRSLNAIYSSVCQEHVDATFMPTYGLFSDGSGQYSAYLKNASGKTVLMRANDGIHFTEAGGDLVGKALIDTIRKYYEID
jgi:hypothetical protein